MLKIYKYSIQLLIIFYLLTSTSHVAFGEVEEVSNKTLSPGVYKMHLNFLKAPNKVPLIYREYLINNLSYNCELERENTSPTRASKFCFFEEVLKTDSYIESNLSKRMHEDHLIISKDDFLLPLFISSGFEFDYTLSEEQIEADVDMIINYIKNYATRAQNFQKAAHLVLSTPSFKQRSAEASVLPFSLSYFQSAGPFEATLRFLNQSECGQSNFLCKASVYELYKDFSKFQNSYYKEVIEPARNIFKALQLLPENELNSIVERKWALEAYNAYINQDYTDFLDLALHSFGHRDDLERRFKKNAVKVLKIIDIFDEQNLAVAQKNLSWSLEINNKPQVNSLVEKQSSYQKEFDGIILKEFIDIKTGFIDVLIDIDKEVFFEQAE